MREFGSRCCGILLRALAQMLFERAGQRREIRLQRANVVAHEREVVRCRSVELDLDANPIFDNEQRSDTNHTDTEQREHADRRQQSLEHVRMMATVMPDSSD